MKAVGAILTALHIVGAVFILIRGYIPTYLITMGRTVRGVFLSQGISDLFTFKSLFF